ncbi:MAG: hypothetical protein V2A56_05090 [bacterium]
MGRKLTGKVILEGTRLTHKTGGWPGWLDHPGFMYMEEDSWAKS